MFNNHESESIELSQPPTIHLSLIVPAYNESKRIESMLIPYVGFLKLARYDFEVIVVDDGSKDNT